MFALTIAIPTYNRASSLRLLLNSLAVQFHGSSCEGEVEVLIVDNCSTDNTFEVVQSYLDHHKNFRYVRNHVNIGSDKNFVSCFQMASGKFLWIVGDDEVLFDGAIHYALKLTNGRDFGCAYLSSEAAYLLEIHKYVGRVAPDRIESIFFKQKDFVKYVNYRLTFLSGTIINKAAVIECSPLIDRDIDRLIGSNLVHLSWVCSSILSRPCSIFISTPLFASTVANSGGYNPVVVFIKNLGDIFEHFFSNCLTDPRRFINQSVLFGWFPKVTYDMRFTNKYKSGPLFAISDFPHYLIRGLECIFIAAIFRSPKPLAYFLVILMKARYKIYLIFIRLTKAVKYAI